MLGFNKVVKGLKKGKVYQRKGWNGKAMFIYLVRGKDFFPDRKPLSDIYDKVTTLTQLQYISMKTADGDLVPWLASQTDILSDDWNEYINE